MSIIYGILALFGPDARLRSHFSDRCHLLHLTLLCGSKVCSVSEWLHESSQFRGGAYVKMHEREVVMLALVVVVVMVVMVVVVVVVVATRPRMTLI